jgi:hypothetical protein
MTLSSTKLNIMSLLIMIKNSCILYVNKNKHTNSVDSRNLKELVWNLIFFNNLPLIHKHDFQMFVSKKNSE